MTQSLPAQSCSGIPALAAAAAMTARYGQTLDASVRRLVTSRAAANVTLASNDVRRVDLRQYLQNKATERVKLINSTRTMGTTKRSVWLAP